MSPTRERVHAAATAQQVARRTDGRALPGPAELPVRTREPAPAAVGFVGAGVDADLAARRGAGGARGEGVLGGAASVKPEGCESYCAEDRMSHEGSDSPLCCLPAPRRAQGRRFEVPRPTRRTRRASLSAGSPETVKRAHG